MEWLGEVPEHWNSQRLKFLMNNVVEPARTQRGMEQPPLYLALEHVESWTGKIRNGRAGALDESVFDGQLKRFLAGDILFGKLRPYLAKITRPSQNGVCVGEFLVLRPARSSVGSRYMEFLLRSQRVIDVVNSSTQGAKMPRAEWTFIGGLPVALPSPDEQRAIARFLDHADRRIRRYIATKEKLIALLEEQKQALVHQAVTGQIDVRTGKPYPAYKDSGVEWLGEVPEHWMIWAAKRFYYESDERSVTGTEELLSVSHLTGVTPRSEKNVTMFKAESHVGHKLCRTGDLVVNTMWAWMAALGLARQDGLVSPSYAVYRCRPSAKLDGEYVESLLRTVSYRDEYRRRSTGIRPSRLRLYPDEFLLMPILCPTPEEQRSIVEYLAETTSKTGAAIQGASRQIDLLRELRTRLIADVVTGKLDVREAAARIPDPVSSADDAPSTIPTPE